jgi:hypothetical protein
MAHTAAREAMKYGLVVQPGEKGKTLMNHLLAFAAKYFMKEKHSNGK